MGKFKVEYAIISPVNPELNLPDGVTLLRIEIYRIAFTSLLAYSVLLEVDAESSEEAVDRVLAERCSWTLSTNSFIL